MKPFAAAALLLILFAAPAFASHPKVKHPKAVHPENPYLKHPNHKAHRGRHAKIQSSLSVRPVHPIRFIDSIRNEKTHIMNHLDDLRYPIGPFIAPATSLSGMRVPQINHLRALPENLRAAVRDLKDAQLDTPYREGGWTVRQVVHHVADSHMNSYVRFKLALTEDWPTIKPYDECAWADLPDSRQPIESSLALIASLHQRWVLLLEAMSDADYRKGFNHPERGRQNLGTTLALYDWHSRHHTAHITSLRARQGW